MALEVMTAVVLLVVAGVGVSVGYFFGRKRGREQQARIHLAAMKAEFAAIGFDLDDDELLERTQPMSVKLRPRPDYRWNMN